MIELSELTDLKTTVARLAAETERLSEELCRLRSLLYGDGSPGLKTTVQMISEWIAEEKARQAEEQRKAWQLRLAIWGWVVAAVLAVATRFF